MQSLLVRNHGNLFGKVNIGIKQLILLNALKVIFFC